MDLDKLYSNLSRLDVIELAIDILENDLSKFIADLNGAQLAEKGQREDGSELSPDYSPVTELLKRPRSGIAGITSHVTLYDTGNLHKSIFASVISDSLVLDSNDWKVSELTEKYGEFLGLTPESIKLLVEKFNPIFVKRLEDAVLQ